MSEGEFKKRILKLNENGMWGENDYSLSAHDVFEILDKVRKEFYGIMNNSSKGYGDLEEAIVKWFGIEEKAKP